MNGGQTENAALTTALAFHYQMLIGLEKCFSLQEGQSVWFETDGDVSLVGNDIEKTSQIEVKDYSKPLTDHHENLWNTLKNWFDPKFDHKKYGALVLHTTQPFGSTTRLKDWNSQEPVQRLKTLKDIYSDRNTEELEAEKPKEIVKLQKMVMSKNEQQLQELLAKVVLHVEADNAEELRKGFCRSLDGFIPKANQQAFAEGMIGFVYEQADKSSWVIDKGSFDQKREFLTARFGPSFFTVPAFTLRDATDEEIEQHLDAHFVQKINEIEYPDVLSEAVGNWLELINSLNEELNGFPQFRNTATRYREQLIKTFNRKYSSACRKSGCSLNNSKDLYDEFIGAEPFGIEGYENPDFVFRNGLIHDAMDDKEKNLKWKIVK